MFLICIFRHLIGKFTKIKYIFKENGNRPTPHPHLICTACKKIVDPELTSLKDVTQELVLDTGFKILNQRLDFFGICPECQK